jgi:hypothetical protein
MHLPGVAAHAQIYAVAVERLVPKRGRRTGPVIAAVSRHPADIAAAAVTGIVPATVTTAMSAAVTTTMMTPALAASVLTLSH